VFYSYQTLDRVLHTHLVRVRKRLLKKTLCGLLANVLNNSRKSHMIAQAHSLRSQHLMTRSMSSWKAELPEMRQKNSLMRMIKNERENKIKAKAIKALQMYLRYRIEKNRNDRMMG
jgi:hypothetical protein